MGTAPCGVDGRFVEFMNSLRVIARIDVKGANAIKGIQMDGLRVIGDPKTLAREYYEEGVDEILYVDVVASLYGRGCLVEIVEAVAQDIFIPLGVVGGIGSVDDAYRAFRSGADKIGLNSAALRDPELLTRLVQEFGGQSIVVSVEAKRSSDGSVWEALSLSGRERTGVDVREWVMLCESIGIGEVLVTSVDRDGTLRGGDAELAHMVADAISVPVLYSGGIKNSEDAVGLARSTGVAGIVIGRALHEGLVCIADLKESLAANGIMVRLV